MVRRHARDCFCCCCGPTDGHVGHTRPPPYALDHRRFHHEFHVIKHKRLAGGSEALSRSSSYGGGRIWFTRLVGPQKQQTSSLACLRTIQHRFPRPRAAQDLLRARESERFIFIRKFAAEQDQLQNPAHVAWGLVAGAAAKCGRGTQTRTKLVTSWVLRLEP